MIIRRGYKLLIISIPDGANVGQLLVVGNADGPIDLAIVLSQ